MRFFTGGERSIVVNMADMTFRFDRSPGRASTQWSILELNEETRVFELKGVATLGVDPTKRELMTAYLNTRSDICGCDICSEDYFDSHGVISFRF